MKRTIKNSLMILLLVTFCNIAVAEVIIITNIAIKQIGINKQDVADMYLDRIRYFNNGTRIKTVDQPPGSKTRKIFYNAILGKSETEMNRYWARRKYSGKGRSPTIVSGDEAIKLWVAGNPGAIGYIDKSSMDSTVRALLIIH